MIKRTKQHIAAIQRLLLTQDFAMFLDWLQSEHESQISLLVQEPSETNVRWLQGRVQLLNEILQAIKETRDVAERMES
ncbi:hypothetical protein [Desulfovibrio inopinatus]|uniref:hypothetical protein n=1 Tax=Desulfovibrio inopinatus TaxID=102109 RepID=UPI000407662F|nr:hypothetical protein [Desulfovibrio inopinatus]